eukprot:366236-Chlamydomonas_euryale.AAC.5
MGPISTPVSVGTLEHVKARRFCGCQVHPEAVCPSYVVHAVHGLVVIRAASSDGHAETQMARLCGHCSRMA